MKYGAAFALVTVALVLPVSGQHGAAHGGSMGSVGHGGFAGHSSGFAGRSGFTGSPGFSHPMGIARPSAPMRPAAPFRPATPFRYGGTAGPGPGWGRMPATVNSGFRSPYRAGRVAPGRPPYRTGVGDHSHGWDHNQGHSHDHGHGNKHVASVFVFGSPGWPFFPYGYSPYPFVIDPGFYDWSLPGEDPAYGQGGASSNYAPYSDYNGGNNAAPQEPNYLPEFYPEQPSDQAPAPSGNRPAYSGAAASTSEPSPREPLMLIFKTGRAPEKIENYIMNAKSLTNLDQQRYEQIPLDQIDIAATEQFNRARGVEFRVPDSTRD